MSNPSLKNIFRLLALCAAAIISSCERRPLVDATDNVFVSVKVVTDNILNVTPGTRYTESVPVPEIYAGIFRVLFYDALTGELVSQNFVSSESTDADGNLIVSGRIKVQAGTYDVLAYSYETESTLIKDDRAWGTITAYTSEVADHLYSRFQSRGDEAGSPIYYQPDHLMVARKQGVTIGEHAGDINISMDAYTIHDTYYIQVRLVNGQYASNATAILSGLSISNNIGPNVRNTQQPSATLFNMYRSTDARSRSENPSVLCAVFNTFGKIYDADSELSVTFNVINSQGKIQELTVGKDEMREVFATEDAVERHWLLVEKEFVIDVPESAGNGGFKPTVEEWNEDTGLIEF